MRRLTSLGCLAILAFVVLLTLAVVAYDNVRGNWSEATQYLLFAWLFLTVFVIGLDPTSAPPTPDQRWRTRWRQVFPTLITAGRTAGATIRGISALALTGATLGLGVWTIMVFALQPDKSGWDWVRLPFVAGVECVLLIALVNWVRFVFWMLLRSGDVPTPQ